MRILHIAKFCPPVFGGIETHVKTLAEGLTERGHDVTVACFASGGTSQMHCGCASQASEGIRWLPLPTHAVIASAPLHFRFRIPSHESGSWDVVHLHMPNPCPELFLALSRQKDFPLVVTWHSDVVRQRFLKVFYRPIYEAVFKRATRIIATSRRYAESSKALSRFLHKVEVVPLGIDPGQFAPNGDRMVEPPYFLFVGRNRYYKGLSVLIAALPEVPSRLIVVTGREDVRSVEDLARRAGVMHRVEIVPDASGEQLLELYRSATALVLPAIERSEAFGLVQVEAMLCGVPVISTDIDSGVPFVNKHLVSGVIVEAGSSRDLSSAMRMLLEDTRLRARLGADARTRATEMFTSDRMTDDTIQVYRQSLAEYE